MFVLQQGEKIELTGVCFRVRVRGLGFRKKKTDVSMQSAVFFCFLPTTLTYHINVLVGF